MSDNDQGGTVVEERLWHALQRLAGTTMAAPDGWERIEERVTARRRRRAKAAWVAVPALTMAMVVALFAVVPTGEERDPEVSAGLPVPAGPARYAPEGLAGGYTLASAATLARSTRADASAVVAYGRRAPDGVALDAVILVVTAGAGPGDADHLWGVPPSETNPTCGPPASSCSGTQARKVTARGRAMDLQALTDANAKAGHDSFKVVWDEPGGPTLGVLTLGVPEGDVLAVVEGLRIDGGKGSASGLPDGFAEVYQGAWPPSPATLAEQFTEQIWIHLDDPQRRFNLWVHEEPALSLDTRAWLLPDAQATDVGGRAALYSPHDHSLSWLPRPGVLVVLSAPALSQADMHALAAKVGPVDEPGWQEILARFGGSSPASGGPGEVSRFGDSTTAGGGPGDVSRFVRPENRPNATVIADGLVAGKPWKITSYSERSDRAGVCIEVSALGGIPLASCQVVLPLGSTPIGRPQFLVLPDSAVGQFLVAPVAKEVAAGWLERADGSRSAVTVSGASAGLAVHFLATPLSGPAPPTAIVALDGAGRELARQKVSVVPPTPAAPPDVLPPTSIPAAPPPPVAVVPPSPTTRGG